MNVRQQLYKKYLSKGYSKYTSARKAGYSHSTALQAKHIEKYINMAYWLEKEGLTDTRLAKHAKAGLIAKKTVSIVILGSNSKLNNSVKVPDWPVRHKYLETILKLGGKLKEAPLIEQHTHYEVTWLTKPKEGDDTILPPAISARNSSTLSKK